MGSIVSSVAGSGEKPQKLTQFLAFNDKWHTFWAPLYLKIVNDNFQQKDFAKPSQSLEEERRPSM